MKDVSYNKVTGDETVEPEDVEEPALSRLTPARPSSDPCSRICCIFPRLGHRYIISKGSGDLHHAPLRLSVGPHWLGAFATTLLICGFTIYLTNNDVVSGRWYRVTCVLLCTLSISCLWKTSCSDPGIIRQAISSGGRFCDICEITVPRTAEHCFDCGVCVDHLDHHCPWIGGCIGEKNMTAFKLFNIAWVSYVFFVVISSVLT